MAIVLYRVGEPTLIKGMLVDLITFL